MKKHSYGNDTKSSKFELEDDVKATGVFQVPFTYNGDALVLKIQADQICEVMEAYEKADIQKIYEEAEAIFKPVKNDKDKT